MQVREFHPRSDTKTVIFFRQALSKHEPVYQALWAQNTEFDEVLISPCMIQDHMPDRVLDALSKVEDWKSSSQYTVVTTISEAVENNGPFDI